MLRQFHLCKWLWQNEHIIVINWQNVFKNSLYFHHSYYTISICDYVCSKAEALSVYFFPISSSYHISISPFPSQLHFTFRTWLCKVSSTTTHLCSLLRTPNSSIMCCCYRTEHPCSPHTPPSDINVSQQQVEEFHRTGFLVLRDILPADIVTSLNQASADLRINKTLHCQMSFYNSPPIFHKETFD